MPDLALVILVLGFLTWGYVAVRAIRDDETTLTGVALMLIVLGIIAATGLSELGVRTPGAWAWFGTGIAMVLVQAYRARRA